MRNLSLHRIPKLIRLLNIEKTDNWRTRNARQILSDGYSTGCTDDAIVFISLARFLNIPTFYVETLKKRWLESLEKEVPKTIEGHVFCDVILDKKVIHFDPRYGKTEIEDGCYIRDPKHERVKYVVLGKGLDFSEIYLEIDGKFEPTPTKLQTIEELRKVIIKRYIK